MSVELTPSEGALTVDQAVASLLTPAAEEQAPEAPAEAAPEVTEPEGGDQPPEEAQAEPEQPAEGEEEPVGEAATPLDPPLYWSPEAKAKFASLDPEFQAELLAQEGHRETATAKAKAEAAKAIEAAQSKSREVEQLAEVLAARVPEWLSAFKDKQTDFIERWGERPDFNAYAVEHGEEAANRLERQYRHEKEGLEHAHRQALEAHRVANAAAETARQQRLVEDFKRLHEIAPDLAPDPADPRKGVEKRVEVTGWLKSLGFTEDTLRDISAEELVIARDAKAYRDLQAKAKAAPPKPAAPPPQRSTARPAASAPPTNAAKSAEGRFHQNPSKENAVALLLAKKA